MTPNTDQKTMEVPTVNDSTVGEVIVSNGVDLSALPPLLTINEVARFVRCSKAHISHLINGTVNRTAALPAVKLGRRTLIRRESLESWLAVVESSW